MYACQLMLFKLNVNHGKLIINDIDSMFVSHFQVFFQTQGEDKPQSRIVKDQGLTSILKSIVRGDNEKTLAKKRYDYPSLKTEQCVCKDLATACSTLCKVSNPTQLRFVTSTALTTTTFVDVVDEWKKETPLFCDVLKSITRKDGT